jgi:hypothetical protein
MKKHPMNFRLLSACGLAIFLGACAEPAYRYDVRGNGEGGVVVNTTPKPPAPPPPPAAYNPPPPPSPAAVDQQQRIDELEARVRNLSAENEKLKQSLTTKP